MNLFDWFRSGPAAAEKVLDAGVSAIDKLVFTEEEKSELKAKMAEQWIELQKALGEETTVRGVTRRILAVLFSTVYIILTLAAAIIWPFCKEYADFLWEVANGQYGYIVLAVVAFYFGPYFLQSLFGGKKG